MPATVAELQNSRTYRKDRSAELVYSVVGVADAADAVAAVEDVRPATFNGLRAEPVQVRPVAIDSGDADSCRWEATASYVAFGRATFRETGESVYNFEIGGGSQKVYQSLSTIAKYPTATAPDFKGAINVGADSVEGVDIISPEFGFSETHYVSATSVDAAYKAALAAAAGKVNNATFRGFAAGEVLFLGATGTKRGNEDYEITYRFAVSFNQTSITVGGIAVAAKGGWEYLWVRYKNDVDTGKSAHVRVPAAVYVEQVYAAANFGTLNLGEPGSGS
jgi:hypothetical protein